METGNGSPDAEWFRDVANGSGQVFFLLRVQPDLAYEFMSPGIEMRRSKRPSGPGETRCGRSDEPGRPPFL